MAAAAQDLAALRALIDKKFPGASVLDAPRYGTLETGIAAVDAVLPGGFPKGAVSLVTGDASCGKTGLVLAAAARLTQQGGQVGWVHDGSFSAPSAVQAGVVPERLLQVRAESAAQALRCADFLLRWQALHLVVLDWHRPGARGAAWNRLQQLTSGAPHALIVLAAPRPPGSPVRFIAAVHLQVDRELRGRRAGLELSLSKCRYSTASTRAVLPAGPPPGRPFALLPELPGLGQRLHEEW